MVTCQEDWDFWAHSGVSTFLKRLWNKIPAAIHVATSNRQNNLNHGAKHLGQDNYPPQKGEIGRFKHRIEDVRA